IERAETAFDVPRIAERFGQEREVDDAAPGRSAATEFRQALEQLAEPSVIAALTRLHASQDHQATVDPMNDLVRPGKRNHAFCAVAGGVVVANLISEERGGAERVHQTPWVREFLRKTQRIAEGSGRAIRIAKEPVAEGEVPATADTRVMGAIDQHVGRMAGRV